MHAHLAGAFETWYDNAKETRRQEDVMSRVLLRWLHQTLTHAFLTWFDGANRQVMIHNDEDNCDHGDDDDDGDD